MNVAKLQAAAFAHLSDSDASKSDASKSDTSKFEASKNSDGGSFDPSESGGDPSVKSNTDPQVKPKPSCPVAAQPDPEVVLTDHAIEVLSHLNLISGSRYQKSKTSLENIRARLRKGYSVADLKLVIDLKHEHWRENDEQYPPSQEEVADLMGASSPNAATDMLRALQRKRVITLVPGVSRGISINSQSAEDKAISLLRSLVAGDEHAMEQARAFLLAQGGAQ